MNVLRRFPVYEASVHTPFDSEAARSLLRIFETRRGALQLRIKSAVAPCESGGSDINFSIAYSPLWWIADVLLFVLISYEVGLAREQPPAFALLSLCLAILIVLTFAGLSMKGAALARRVQRAASSSVARG